MMIVEKPPPLSAYNVIRNDGWATLAMILGVTAVGTALLTPVLKGPGIPAGVLWLGTIAIEAVCVPVVIFRVRKVRALFADGRVVDGLVTSNLRFRGKHAVEGNIGYRVTWDGADIPGKYHYTGKLGGLLRREPGDRLRVVVVPGDPPRLFPYDAFFGDAAQSG